MTTQLIRKVMRSTVEVGLDPTEMTWFDISANTFHAEHVGTDPLMTHRPPFEKCVVLWRGATENHKLYEITMLVAGTDPEEGIVIDMSKGVPGRMQTFPPIVYLIDGDLLRYGAVDEDAEIDEGVAKLMLALVAKWYEALDRKCAAYQPVLRDTFTNRRKLAEGKLPTYDWRTVRIEPVKPRSEHQGGTHASPRQHDRRGHLRRLKSGKTCWVKACKVGDPTKGAVFHDYEVKA
jgi:hypothetical protein